MNKPDFSGTWKFNQQKSLLEIPAPDFSSFLIRHDEPDFFLTRTLVMAGVKDTFSISLRTDGKTVSIRHRGMGIKAQLRWEENILVFDTVILRDDDEATNVVRYRLEDEGKTFIAEEQFTSAETSYKNIWVLEKS